jgi:hypothetical protein
MTKETFSHLAKLEELLKRNQSLELLLIFIQKKLFLIMKEYFVLLEITKL